MTNKVIILGGSIRKRRPKVFRGIRQGLGNEVWGKNSNVIYCKGKKKRIYIYIYIYIYIIVNIIFHIRNNIEQIIVQGDPSPFSNYLCNSLVFPKLNRNA
jgi:hypothetical protein